MECVLDTPIRTLRATGSALIDFLFPSYCVFCDQPLTNLLSLSCAACLGKLHRANGGHLEEIKKKRTDLCLSEIRSLWTFTEDAQLLIHNLKYNFNYAVGHDIAEMMFKYLITKDFLGQIDAVVPVPLHRFRKLKRGYNQSEILAKRLSQLMNKPLLNNCLKRVRHTKSQTKLNIAEREKNVANAFRLHQKTDVSNKRILLIDDVITTGSTINSCALQLKQHGVKTVYAVSAIKA